MSEVRNYTKKNGMNNVFTGLVLGAAIISVPLIFKAMTATPVSHNKVAESIRANFPNTKFERIEYNKDLKLYEAESGETIIYLTGERYALAGNIIDLKENTDVTAKRRNELKQVNALKDSILGKPSEPSVENIQRAAPRGPVGENAPSADNRVIDVDLKPEHYVVHNEGGGEVVYVLSDYNCPHCRNLYNSMKGMPYEIREIPVGFLGQNSSLKAAEVLCAENREEAVNDVYHKGRNEPVSTCSEGEGLVAANTRWASENGLTSTPSIIRADGRIKSGGGPRQVISDFINGAS